MRTFGAAKRAVAVGAAAVLAIGAGAAGAVAAPVVVQPPGQPVAEVVPSSLVADGERYAAWITLDRVLHVVDERDPDGSFEIAVPESCVEIDRGNPMAPGGQYLLTCARGSGFELRWNHLRLDLATRSWHELAAGRWDSPRIGVPWQRPQTIGSRWLELDTSDETTKLGDWRSGETIDVVGEATDAIDLGGDQPLRRMCAPLTRPLPADSRRWMPFAPTLYDGSTAVASHPGGRLSAQRCGEPRRTLLSDGYPDRVQLGSGLLTYTAYTNDDADVAFFAYLPSCRVRLGWAASFPTAAAHTAGVLWIEARREQNDYTRATARRLALPDVCAAIPVLTVATRGRATGRLRAAAWQAPAWGGAEVALLPRPGATPPRQGHAGQAVLLRSARAARRVSWRVDGGRARSARRVGRDGRRWRFTPQRSAAGREVTVTVAGAGAGGGSASFHFKLGA
ncbi:hypothetical protein VSS74_08280 [Conexibacter stalactiti]|uniref:Uncharacterized protein n=1 Tax=Conexibacter stalactiti TaxID=1940611 RepID=A0ABU4HNP0_9ACTN|nr:hypothetical protein [Conexibacter stalactiti]MDW5594329.1 hypothetical protein [Conexibacter stalactiti]MEC5034971.1 hypothetical protein [Conexibacter stalactiti]